MIRFNKANRKKMFLNLGVSVALIMCASSTLAQADAVDIQAYQDAYNYAYGDPGLNLTSAAAQAFANQITSYPNPEQSLKTFQDAYSYAYGDPGLNLTGSAAMALAYKFAARSDGESVLQTYEKDYQFAYGDPGLNEDAADARAFAEQKSGLDSPDPGVDPGAPDGALPSYPKCQMPVDMVAHVQLLEDLSKILDEKQQTLQSLLNGYCVNNSINGNQFSVGLAQISTDLDKSVGELQLAPNLQGALGIAAGLQ